MTTLCAHIHSQRESHHTAECRVSFTFGSSVFKVLALHPLLLNLQVPEAEKNFHVLSWTTQMKFNTWKKHLMRTGGKTLFTVSNSKQVSHTVFFSELLARPSYGLLISITHFALQQRKEMVASISIFIDYYFLSWVESKINKINLFGYTHQFSILIHRFAWPPKTGLTRKEICDQWSHSLLIPTLLF